MCRGQQKGDGICSGGRGGFIGRVSGWCGRSDLMDRIRAGYGRELGEIEIARATTVELILNGVAPPLAWVVYRKTKS